jgi:thiamine-monophosphate kinase
LWKSPFKGVFTLLRLGEPWEASSGVRAYAGVCTADIAIPGRELPYSQGVLGKQKADSAPGEPDLLRELRARAARGPQAGLRLGIGDDCALIAPRRGEELAVTTDLSIAGRHFRLEWHPPEAVGHRALARGLSDLAAMGARPVAAFLSLGLPRELTRAAGRKTSSSWMSRFLDGLLRLAGNHKVPLAGGDLSESPLAVADIVLVGAVPRGRALLRSGARPGDLLYVTGTLGGAAAGLERMKGAGSGAARSAKKAEPALAPHLYPQPRVAQGMWLVRRGAATAAIDLSDGLSTDLGHIGEESGVGAEIDALALPVAPGATLEQALHGGEDYELLFAARPAVRLPRAIAGVRVTRFGRVVRRRKGKPTVTLVSPQGRQPLEPRGWEHFK